MSLEDKAALITGAGSGVGAATAAALAAAGARAGLTDVDGAAAEAVATHLANPAARTLDVTREADRAASAGSTCW